MDLIARRPSVSSSLLRNVFANAHTIATSRAVIYIGVKTKNKIN